MTMNEPLVRMTCCACGKRAAVDEMHWVRVFGWCCALCASDEATQTDLVEWYVWALKRARMGAEVRADTAAEEIALARARQILGEEEE